MFIFFLTKDYLVIRSDGGEGEAGKAGVVRLRSVISAQPSRLVHSYD